MFDDLFRALLGVPGVLVTVARAACRTEGRHRHLAGLTPASGCRDHTASSNASHALRLGRPRVHRIPASRFVTIAIRPSSGGGMMGGNHIILKNGSKIFFTQGLDTNSQSRPTGKSPSCITLAYRQKLLVEKILIPPCEPTESMKLKRPAPPHDPRMAWCWSTRTTAKARDGQAFVDWLVSSKGQELRGRRRTAIFPNASHWQIRSSVVTAIFSTRLRTLDFVAFENRGG